MDAPDQVVTHGDGFAGVERQQAVTALEYEAVLDEGRVTVDANAIGVF